MPPTKSPSSAMARISAKAEREADLVMGTNDSSIVSKRSVEMLYYPKPHFFRSFVKRPQRRSPIINRGYWLRMYAMLETVRRFMRAPSDKPKFVLNLGCGFDPLPFMLLSADGPLCKDTTFVDIDYEKLMVHKKSAIHGTTEITDLLENVEFLADESAVQIHSERYVAIGCDLKNLKKLEDTLRTEIFPSSSECSILCLAEVSLTYMDVKSANAVLNWAPMLSSDVQFCILEQFFPDGPHHPFASTMMKHFNKVGAPLHSIHEYPSLQEQEQRFKNAGWTQARARCLWDLWSDDDFLAPSTRISLDGVELFDEWEEFALFASHYFLLHASNKQPHSDEGLEQGHDRVSETSISSHFQLLPHCPPGGGQRRYGALIPDSDGSLGYHGGLGRQTRLATTDLYTVFKEQTEPTGAFPPPQDISARMCHTVTSLTNGDCLLVGGRVSPASVLQDCWFRQGNEWRPVNGLPAPRFRHNAIQVILGANSELVLVYGGKTSNGQLLDTWLLWGNNGHGWQAVETTGSQPSARYGACLAKTSDASGVMFGGIGPEGAVLRDFWTWDLHQRSDGVLSLELTDRTDELKASPLFKYLHRFGASVSPTQAGLIIVGGIMSGQIVPLDKEIVFLDSAGLRDCLYGVKPWSDHLISSIGLGADFNGPRPLLTGHSSCTVDTNGVLILGGGAVCYAFGTVWTEGTWLLGRADSQLKNEWEMKPAIVQPAKNA